MSRGSPRSPLLTAKESILFSRLTDASNEDDDDVGKAKISNLLSRHAVDGSTLNAIEDSVSPLMQAAIKGNVLCCREFIEAGADPNTTTSYGWSSVHFAAALGKDRCLTVLLQVRYFFY
jgi:hypothetical protein